MAMYPGLNLKLPQSAPNTEHTQTSAPTSLSTLQTTLRVSEAFWFLVSLTNQVSAGFGCMQVNCLCAEQSYCFGFKLQLQRLADGNRTCKLFSVIRRADGFLETNAVRGECV